MNRARVVTVAVIALVLAGTSQPALKAQSGLQVIATGLDNPRGLAFGTDGALYVVEAGRGGTSTLCLPFADGQPGLRCYGPTGAVTRISGLNTQQRVVTGLPSLAGPTGERADRTARHRLRPGPHVHHDRVRRRTRDPCAVRGRRHPSGVARAGAADGSMGLRRRHLGARSGDQSRWRDCRLESVRHAHALRPRGHRRRRRKRAVPDRAQRHDLDARGVPGPAGRTGPRFRRCRRR